MPLRVYLYLVTTILMWSHAFVAIKYCLRYVSPWELLVLRHVPAAAAFAAYLVAFRSTRDLFQILRSDGLRFLLLGAVAVTGYHLALNIGAQSVPAGTVSLVIGTSPVFTMIAAMLLIRERPVAVQIVGVFVAFVGIYVCIRLGGGRGLGIDYLFGAFVLLLSPIFAAIHTTLSRPFAREYGALNTTAITIILGTAPLLFGVDGDLVRKLPGLPVEFWAAILFLGLGCTATAFLLWAKALEAVEATRVAVFNYLIPVLGITWGWLYLGETVSYWLLLGAVLVIAGVMLAAAPGRMPREIT